MNKIILFVLLGVIIIFGIGFYLSQQSVTAPSVSSTQTPTGYQGELLAGSSSPYLAFTKGDYEKARGENKIIFLDFYADWCPICRAEEPALLEGFNKLTTDNVVGFRVNFKDSDTDEDEKALAKEFNVPYQHYKVIIKDGKVVFTSPDQWSSETLVTEIQKVDK